MRVINLEDSGNPHDLYRLGPVARLRIGFTINDLSPNLESELFIALIDTGATNSSIDVSIAEDLRLPIIGDPENQVGANGPFKSQPVLGFIEIVDIAAFAYRRFGTLPLIEHGLPYHAVLGRDFLSQGVFTYDGPRGTCGFDFE